MRTLILFVLAGALATSASAQSDTLALDPNEFVNTQILGDTTSSGERIHSVYTVDPGTFYAFDGRLDITFPVEIVGPDNDWLRNNPAPPVLLNTPGQQGEARQFFELQAGGSLVLKNLMMSGLVSTGETAGVFTANTGGSLYKAQNVVFTNWQDFVMRNQATNIDISVTDCIFINGVRTTNSQWGGFPIRMDVSGENVLIENNTVVNSARLLANSGPFLNGTIHLLHNSYINPAKNSLEQRANEMIQANNIFYNYDFLGRKHDSIIYESYFTTWNYFSEAADSLDKISLYLGQNLFYREPELLDWFETQADTILPGLLWEHASVDSFVISDTDYTIGTNYSGFDPGFTVPPDNTDEIVQFTAAMWLTPNDPWVDWRIENPVDFDGNGQPFTNWPPDFDLSYDNEFLQTAGTDNLPLGDLNWFPNAKDSYLANRDQHVAALRDSINNAVAVYVPGSPTPLITPETVSTEGPGETPAEFSLHQNYPNPFNPATNILFTLSRAADVELSVYNLLGQRVAVLLDNELRTAGTHAVEWDGRDESGNPVASGAYVYRLKSGDISKARTMLLIQ